MQTLRVHRHGVTCVLQTASTVLGTSNPLAEPDLPRLLVSAAEGIYGRELGSGLVFFKCILKCEEIPTLL